MQHVQEPQGASCKKGTWPLPENSHIFALKSSALVHFESYLMLRPATGVELTLPLEGADNTPSQLPLSENEGATENAGVENAGASKMQGWKSREKRIWKAKIPVRLSNIVVESSIGLVCSSGLQ